MGDNGPGSASQRVKIEMFLGYILAILALFSEEVPHGLHPILDPAFQQKLNETSNSVLALSEEIQVLVDGKESYPVRWRMLENAEHSIHLTTMYIFRDKTTNKLRDLLVQKKKEGVDVKLIVYGPYSVGNFGFYRYLRKRGVEVKKYSGWRDVLLRNPLRFWRRHLHDKYLVVDGKEALLGGMNWSGRYARGGRVPKNAWRDTDVYIRGPQAEIIEKEFMKRWYLDEAPEQSEEIAAKLEETYRALLYPTSRSYTEFMQPNPAGPPGYTADRLTRFLYQQPFEQDGAIYVTNFYKEIIDRAQSHVWWQSISTRPAPIQKEALIAAAARGVDVRLMTNSQRNMGMIPIGGFIIYTLTALDYRELLKAGIRIFEYRGNAPMHSKGFIVDGVVAAVGSYNATFTAEHYYTESALAIYDHDAIEDLYQMFEDDFAVSTEVTLETLDAAKKKAATITCR